MPPGLPPEKWISVAMVSEQQPASRGEQPYDRRALPKARRRLSLHREHIGAVEDKGQREQKDVDQRDAEHRRAASLRAESGRTIAAAA